MRISDLGEFGLIELVQQWTRDPGRSVEDSPAAVLPGPWWTMAMTPARRHICDRRGHRTVYH